MGQRRFIGPAMRVIVDKGAFALHSVQPLCQI
jgi:hypothetical protein